MVTILSITAFLIIRAYYKDLYKIIFYVSIPFVILMLLIVSSGDLVAAEEIGNAVFLFFVLLNIEVIFSKFIDKAAVHAARVTEYHHEKKKRLDVRKGVKRI